MNIKRIACMILAVCLITAAAFSATAVYGNGSDDIIKYAGETTEYSVKAAGAKDVQDYIDGYLSDNAGILSEWMIITLARSNAKYDFSSYVGSLNKYVKNNKVESASKRLLYSLAFLCCGDTDNAYIKSSVNDSIGELGIMSYIYGLHMLNNGYTSDKFTVSSVIDQLLSVRLEDGGWALFGTVSDIDVSAMTVQALAPYYKTDSKVKKAIDEAMSLLSSRQLEDGSYKGFGKENCESTAQVAIAMASLGIDRKTDQRFIKNGKNIIDGMLKFKLDDNSYCHVIDGGYNFMATVQTLMAYISFERAESGKSTFYSVRKTSAAVTTTAQETQCVSESITTITVVSPASNPTHKTTSAASVITSKQIEQTADTKSLSTVHTTAESISEQSNESNETETVTTSLTSTRIETETSTSSAAPSTSDTAGGSESDTRITSAAVTLSETHGNNDENKDGKSGALTFVIIFCAAAVIIAAVAYIILKKKNK